MSHRCAPVSRRTRRADVRSQGRAAATGRTRDHIRYSVPSRLPQGEPDPAGRDSSPDGGKGNPIAAPSDGLDGASAPTTSARRSCAPAGALAHSSSRSNSSRICQASAMPARGKMSMHVTRRMLKPRRARRRSQGTPQAIPSPALHLSGQALDRRRRRRRAAWLGGPAQPGGLQSVVTAGWSGRSRRTCR
jgi:hypothetical protein